MDSKKVRVQFESQEPEYAIATAPILVPASLSRYGLSRIVNQLLQLDTAVPFNFLINDTHLLKSSLARAADELNTSLESILRAKFFRSALPPKKSGSIVNSDWISDIALRRASQSSSKPIPPGDDLAAVSKFDGSISIINTSNRDIVASYESNASANKKNPLHCITWTNTDHVLAGSADGSVRSFAVFDRKLLPNAVYASEEESLHCICAVSSTRFIAGSATGNIMTYASSLVNDQQVSNNDEETEAQSAKKRRKVSKTPNGHVEVCNETGNKKHQTEVTINRPIAKWKAHKTRVSEILATSDPNKAYSIGWDCALTSWDLVVNEAIEQKIFADPLTAALRFANTNLIVLGATNGHLYAHDIRSNLLASRKFEGHKNTISCLAVCDAHSEHLFASGSFDGTVKIWDIRSPKASLYSIRESGSAKIFALGFSPEAGILAGGEASVVNFYDFKT